ncbi:MAG: ATP-binding cassette domain-containing protein [Nanoarchaeota archaeon]
MQPLIVVDSVSRVFGRKRALDKVSLAISKGESFGLLGPNGAGKTTLLSLLMTLRCPSEGKITIKGFDVVTQDKAIRALLGVVFQEFLLDEDLTARDNLKIHAMLYKIPSPEKRINELLRFIGLEKETGKVKVFSGGMKRRLEIARGLLNRPEILILDEPTLGLDPIAKSVVWKQIKKINKEGTTVILATNDVYEAERLCKRIAMIDHGRILYCDSVVKVKKKYKTIEKMFFGVAGK